MKTSVLAFSAIIAMTFTSCYQSYDNTIESLETSQVKFELAVEGVNESSLTRAISAPENVLVLDKYDGTVSAVTKSSLESISLPLQYGKHDLYFVAATKKWASHDDENLTVTWNNDYSSLTTAWAYHLELNVGPDTEVQSIKLPMVISLIKISSTDVIPSNVKTLSVEAPDICRVLDLSTMSGLTSATNYEVSADVSSMAGTKKFNIDIYTFVPSTGAVGDITLTAYNASGTELLQRTISEVIAKKGYIENYSGSIFSGQVPVPVTYTDDWTDTENHSF